MKIKTMKTKLLSVLLFITFNFQVNAQIDSNSCIQIFGYAEKFITPDIIDVSFSLNEYNEETKSTRPIAEQEEILFKTIRDIGLSESNFKLDNFSKQNIYKKKNTESYDKRWYILSLNDLQKLMTLYNCLQTLNLSGFKINELKSTQIEKYKTELYKEAMLIALKKAEAILSVVNKKVGNPIEIKEDFTKSYNQECEDPVKFDRTTKRMIPGDFFSNQYELSIGDIKLKYKLIVKFEIVK